MSEVLGPAAFGETPTGVLTAAFGETPTGVLTAASGGTPTGVPLHPPTFTPVDTLTDAARLVGVAEASTAAGSPHAALQRLTAIAARLTGARFAFLSLVAVDVEVLLVAAGEGASALPGVLTTDQSICQHLVRLGSPLVVPDLREDARMSGLVEVRELGMRSYAGAPVRSGEGLLLGGLCVADDVPRDWTGEEVVLLIDLAEAASAELAALVRAQELARSLVDERRRAREQEALHRIAASVVRGDLPERVLQQAANEVIRLLGAEAALVVRFRPDGGTTVVVSAGHVGVTGRAWSWFGRLLRDVPHDDVRDAEEVLGDPCAAAPITVGGQRWGALVVALGPEGSRGEIEHLQQLADLLALVLVNAEGQLQLTRLARTDPLTGAPNRRVFEDRLAFELARSPASSTSLVVALVDVDHFKQVNDRHGHDVGDAVLRALVERIGDVLAEDELLARFGGDEWGLLLPGVPDAAQALDRVRLAVAAAPVAGVDITVTVGGAVTVTGAAAGALTSREALRRADAALYAAKRRGRNSTGLA